MEQTHHRSRRNVPSDSDWYRVRYAEPSSNGDYTGPRGGYTSPNSGYYSGYSNSRGYNEERLYDSRISDDKRMVNRLLDIWMREQERSGTRITTLSIEDMKRDTLDIIRLELSKPREIEEARATTMARERGKESERAREKEREIKREREIKIEREIEKERKAIERKRAKVVQEFKAMKAMERGENRDIEKDRLRKALVSIRERLEVNERAKETESIAREKSKERYMVMETIERRKATERERIRDREIAEERAIARERTLYRPLFNSIQQAIASEMEREMEIARARERARAQELREARERARAQELGEARERAREVREQQARESSSERELSSHEKKWVDLYLKVYEEEFEGMNNVEKSFVVAELRDKARILSNVNPNNLHIGIDEMSKFLKLSDEKRSKLKKELFIKAKEMKPPSYSDDSSNIEFTPGVPQPTNEMLRQYFDKSLYPPEYAALPKPPEYSEQKESEASGVSRIDRMKESLSGARLIGKLQKLSINKGKGSKNERNPQI